MTVKCFVSVEIPECASDAPRGSLRRGLGSGLLSGLAKSFLYLLLLFPALASARDATTRPTESSAAAGALSAGPDTSAKPATQSTPSATEKGAIGQHPFWNFHLQNTDIVQGYPPFSAQYSGPQSLPTFGEARETVSLDVMAGVRLWSGAEAHLDGLMWQGFGLNNVLGVEGFPSGEAYRIGTDVPNGSIARLFVRQTIGLGGEQEDVADDQFALAAKRDISRLTLTFGRFSLKGEAWHRSGDTVGLAGVANGISRVEQEFLGVGGSGILAGDGNLNYGWEKILETYYDARIWKMLHGAVDYQFIGDPAFNRSRGPVSIFGLRFHWQL
jgi:hypothetical protein